MPSGTKTACRDHAVLCFANENNLLARNLLTIRPKITLMAYMKIGLARDAYDQRKRKLKREQLFGEMSPEELNKLITTDRYFQFERDIVEDGLRFIVCDQVVYDALMTLPGAKRKIVLLSYFGEMNDREIGDALGTGRANVQYHRSRALAMMRKMLEQESEEY